MNIYTIFYLPPNRWSIIYGLIRAWGQLLFWLLVDIMPSQCFKSFDNFISHSWYLYALYLHIILFIITQILNKKNNYKYQMLSKHAQKINKKKVMRVNCPVKISCKCLYKRKQKISFLRMVIKKGCSISLVFVLALPLPFEIISRPLIGNKNHTDIF